MQQKMDVRKRVDATAFFRKPNGGNCAQAVLMAFAPATGMQDQCLSRFCGWGGGQAPGGECGALAAAKRLLACPQARKRLEEAFGKTAGSTKCRDIRAGRRVSCQQCVQTAADLVTLETSRQAALANPCTAVPA